MTRISGDIRCEEEVASGEWLVARDPENQVDRSRKWYISHELLSFEGSSKRTSAGKKRIVWENLILIKARGPGEAYRKAVRHGRLSEGQVKIDGENGHCKFKGLRDLVLIYDPLQDGTEIEWHDLQLSQSQLARILKKKHQMQAFNIGPERRSNSKET